MATSTTVAWVKDLRHPLRPPRPVGTVALGAATGAADATFPAFVALDAGLVTFTRRRWRNSTILGQ